MILKINDEDVRVEYIRIYRDALRTEFHALVNDEWIKFIKGKDKRLPKYYEVDWPDKHHKYGWSNPFRVRDR